MILYDYQMQMEPDRTEVKALAALAHEAMANRHPVQKTRTQPVKERPHAWEAGLAAAARVSASRARIKKSRAPCG
jgi:hypothetical protein